MKSRIKKRVALCFRGKCMDNGMTVKKNQIATSISCYKNAWMKQIQDETDLPKKNS